MWQNVKWQNRHTSHLVNNIYNGFLFYFLSLWLNWSWSENAVILTVCFFVWKGGRGLYFIWVQINKHIMWFSKTAFPQTLVNLWEKPGVVQCNVMTTITLCSIVFSGLFSEIASPSHLFALCLSFSLPYSMSSRVANHKAEMWIGKHNVQFNQINTTAEHFY